MTQVSDKAKDMLKAFDYEPKEEKAPFVRIPGMKHWNVCVILGPSGTGKTTSLKRFGDPSDVDVNWYVPVIDLTGDPETLVPMYRKCGFGSVPSWCLPYGKLSNGERYRVQIALKLLRGDNPVILDEFGSYLDAPSAVMLASLVRKLASTTGRKFLIATLNPVIAQELEPDELIELGVPSIRRSLRRERVLQIQRVSRNAWQIFKKHHYMSSNILSASKCFMLTWDNEIVAFNALKPFPHGTIKNAYNGHRTVVLPNFQGFGLGPLIADLTGGIAAAHGYTVYTKTVHPSLGEYRERSGLWEGTAMNRKEGYNVKQTNLPDALNRLSYCHRYVGTPRDDLADLWWEPDFDHVENDEINGIRLDRLTNDGLFKFMK